MGSWVSGTSLDVVVSTDTTFASPAKVEVVVVDTPGAEDEQDCKNTLGQGVENAVKDVLAGGGDDVSVLGDTCADVVEEQEEYFIGCEHGEDATRSGIEGTDMRTGNSEEVPTDENEGKNCEDEKSPFVICGSESAEKHQSGPDHGEESGKDDSCPADAAKEGKSEDDDGEVEEVANPSRVEDLAGITEDVVIVVDTDSNRAKVGGQAEVIDRCDE